MATTSIEWTQNADGSPGQTWNPLAGCSICSPGCTNCYAMRMAARLEAMGQPKYVGLTVKKNGRAVWTGKITTDDDALMIPLKRKKPTIWFVNSMSDLFHEGVPFEFVDKVFAVMALTPQHTYQILTKRPDRMAEYTSVGFGRIADRIIAMRRESGDRCVVVPLPNIPPGRQWWPLPNVWLGTSVENQEWADKRIPHLLRCPAAVRFLSAEPLLSEIRLFDHWEDEDFEEWVRKGIHWVIVGGESGHGARPMHPDWALSIRDQCQAAGVPFFFKQWGEWAPCHMARIEDNGHYRELDHMTAVHRVGKKAAGRLLDDREWNEWPEDLRIRQMPEALHA